MTYAFSWPLQQALYQALRADAALAEVVEGRIFDEPPHGASSGDDPAPFVVIGDEAVDPWSTATDRGAAHAVQISVIGGRRGFAALKRAAAAICEVALGPLALSRGRVVNASFLGGRTRRIGRDALRRIDLRFRIAIEDAG